MEKKTLHLLMLEDSFDDAEMVVRELKRQGFVVEWSRVETEEDFREALDKKPALILADYALPSFDGMTALKIQQEIAPQIPLVIISGTIGEEVAIECMKSGATDYVLKDRLFRLGPVVKRAIEEAEVYRERKRAEEEIKAKSQFLESLIQQSPLSTFIIDAEGTCVMVNQAFLEEYHLPDESLIIGKNALTVPANVEQGTTEHMKRALSGEFVRTPEIEFISPLNGSRTVARSTLFPIYGPSGTLTNVVVMQEDITERVRAEAALRESEERYRLLAENVTDVIWAMDLNLRFTYISPAVTRMLGYSVEEAMALTLQDVLPPASFEVAMKDLAEELAIEDMEQKDLSRSRTMDLEYCCKDGSTIWVEIKATGLHDPDGQLVEILGVSRDITERVQAEEELRRVSRALETLSECNQAVVRATDEPNLLHDICRIVVQVGGYRLAWAGFAEQDEEKTVRPVAQAGFEEGYLDTVNVTWADTERGRGPTGTAIRTGEPAIAKNILPDPDYAPWRAEAIRRGYASSIALPLIVEGQALGALNIYAAEPDAFDAEVVNLLTDLADDMAYGIVALRTRAERKQAEKALRESEERYRDLIESTYDLIQSVAPDGRFIFVNQAWLETLGYTEAQLPSLDLWKIIHPESLLHCRKIFSGVMAGESIQNVQATFVAKDGRAILVEGNMTGRYIGDRLVATYGFFRDVTERKRAENALRKSEQRYRSLFESLPVGLYRMTPKGRILHANPALVQMLGYPDRRALMAVNALDLYVDSEDHERQQALLEREGIVRDFEMQFRRYDGTIIWVQNTMQAVRSDRGHAFYYEGSMEDITERKRAEEERDRLVVHIHEQAQQVQQIIDTVPEGVLLLDAAGQVILANPLGRKDLAALANASVGNTLTHLGDRPLAELLTLPYQGFWHEVALEGPPPRVFEIIAKPIETGPTPGGACPEPALSVAEGPVEGACPEPVEGWVLVIRDMTREREFQRYSQQQERLATVGQLAAGIAHDFNNIMATIVLYAQMLSQTEDLSPRGHERLATVNQQALHATNLIQQILDFSRRAVLERRPLNLLPLLKEQIKLLERTLPENIEIALAYGPDEYTVNADPTRMQQAVMNLALNARDAMPGGGDLRIGLERIQVQPGESPPLPEMEAGEWVQVTVSDTGTGIPPDILPHIFDPFFTTKAPGEGSGLGLAQVHGIVKQHEGEIGAQSPFPSELVLSEDEGAEGLRPGQAGQGTTFTIYLPALPVHPAEAPTLEMEALTKGQGETILVVEDNRATRQALVDSLELLNYRTLEASDGQEALEILERQSSEISSPEVSLVLSDVVMPGMGGVALFHALRQRSLAVKVVLMSGHPLEEEMESLRTQGLSDWLPKPPSLEQLAQVVARALNL